MPSIGDGVEALEAFLKRIREKNGEVPVVSTFMGKSKVHISIEVEGGEDVSDWVTFENPHAFVEAVADIYKKKCISRWQKYRIRCERIIDDAPAHETDRRADIDPRDRDMHLGVPDEPVMAALLHWGANGHFDGRMSNRSPLVGHMKSGQVRIASKCGELDVCFPRHDPAQGVATVDGTRIPLRFDCGGNTGNGAVLMCGDAWGHLIVYVDRIPHPTAQPVATAADIKSTGDDTKGVREWPKGHVANTRMDLFVEHSGLPFEVAARICCAVMTDAESAAGATYSRPHEDTRVRDETPDIAPTGTARDRPDAAWEAEKRRMLEEGCGVWQRRM